MIRPRTLLCAVWPLLAGTAAARAQDAISTDRPGFGFSAATVPSGAAQLEIGLPLAWWDRSPGTSSHGLSFPSVLRIGAVRGLELRAGSPVYTRRTERDSRGSTMTSGFGGLELGAKLSTSGRGSLSLAVVPSVVLPLGDAAVTGRRTACTLNTVMTAGLGGDFGVSAVLGVAAVPSGRAGYRTSGTLVAVLSRRLSRRVGGYAEGAWFPASGNAAPLYTGGGLTWLLSPGLQLDLSVDHGLNGAATSWLAGAGMAVRL